MIFCILPLFEEYNMSFVNVLWNNMARVFVLDNLLIECNLTYFYLLLC